jgi:hypothetical protein
MKENSNKRSNNYNDKEIKALLKENIKLNKEMYEMLEKVKKYMMWQRAFSFLKILIIVIPIILGIIYLPPILSEVFEQYKSILGVGTSNVDVNKLLETMQNK